MNRDPLKEPETTFVRKRAASLFLALLLMLPSCGYHRAERTAELSGSIRSIHIAPWTNRSNELLLGAWITDELRREFLRGSGLSLATAETADVILEGEIAQIDTTGLSYVRHDRAVERKIYVKSSVKMTDRRTGKLLWNTRDIIREEGFSVGRDVMETEGLKEEALRKLSVDIAELVYHRITGVF